MMTMIMVKLRKLPLLFFSYHKRMIKHQDEHNGNGMVSLMEMVRMMEIVSMIEMVS